MTSHNKFVSIIILTISCLLLPPIFIAHASAIAQYKGVEFLTPLASAPQKDVFTYTDQTNLSGNITYDVLTLSPAKKYVVVRTIKNGKQAQVISLPVQTSLSLLGVKMSPNGRYIFIKIGTMGDDSDQYNTYFWDLKTQAITAGPSNLTYYRVVWSPDSQYIAYNLGGDVNGDEYGVAGSYRPLKLFTFNILNQKTSFVALGQTLTYFSWTDKDTLLLSLPKNYPINAPETFDEENMKSAQLLNIYEASADAGKLRIVIEGGYHAVLSPDDKYIVYLAHTNTNAKTKGASENQTSISYPYLTIFDIKNKTVRLIPGQRSDLYDLKWTQDSQKLVLSHYNYTNATGSLAISTIGIKNLDEKKLAQINVQDSEPTYRNKYQPQFRVLKVAQDNSYLLVQTQQFGKSLGNHYYQIPYSLDAINLTSGTVVTLCTTEHISTYDWHTIR